MHRSRLALQITGVLVANLLAWWVLKPLPPATIQGRTLKDWLSEAVCEPGPMEKPSANKVLYAAGPSIIPELSRLLLRADCLNSLAAELPSAWVPSVIKARGGDQLAMQAKAAWVISVIAYRNPNSDENRDAVASLIASLNSRSKRVQHISAQALAAIGPAASNAVPMLALKTTDQSSSVRLCAVDALGRIGFASDNALKALRAALSDANSDVRLVATNALERLQ